MKHSLIYSTKRDQKPVTGSTRAKLISWYTKSYYHSLIAFYFECHLHFSLATFLPECHTKSLWFLSKSIFRAKQMMICPAPLHPMYGHSPSLLLKKFIIHVQYVHIKSNYMYIYILLQHHLENKSNILFWHYDKQNSKMVLKYFLA